MQRVSNRTSDPAAAPCWDHLREPLPPLESLLLALGHAAVQVPSIASLKIDAYKVGAFRGHR